MVLRDSVLLKEILFSPTKQEIFHLNFMGEVRPPPMPMYDYNSRKKLETPSNLNLLKSRYKAFTWNSIKYVLKYFFFVSS